MPPQEELDGFSPSAEDDVLQLSVIRTGAGGAGTQRLRANNKTEDTVSKVLATLTDTIRSFSKTDVAQRGQGFHKNAAV